MFLIRFYLCRRFITTIVVIKTMIESTGILQDEFEIKFKGYIDLPPTRIDYDFICPDDNQHYVWDNDTNCNNNCNEPCQQNLNYPRLVTTGARILWFW